MDLPMAQIPNFQLPGPAPIQQQPGLFQGLAAGVPKGFDIASQFQQLALQKQQQAMMQQKMMQEQQQQEMTEKLKKFQLVTDLYKNTHKSLRPKLWETVVNQSNALLGTQLDPSIMPESANDAVDAAHQEIQNFIDKKQSFGDTMKKLGMLSVTLDEETRKAVESSKGFLMDTPEGQKAKNEGVSGSFSFAGYDPKAKQPIFSYSKAPMLVREGGVPYSGPVQSKADLDRAESDIAEVKGAESAINEVENLLKEIPSGWEGKTQSTAARFIPGMDLIFKKAGQYNDQIPALSMALYRVLTGDKSKSSDADARQRALPFMAKPGEDPKIQKDKFAVLRRMAQQRIKDLQRGISETPWNPQEYTEQQSTELSGKAKSVISKWENK